MSIYLFILSILVGLTFAILRRYKLVATLFLISFMMLLLIGNTDNPDLENYELLYETIARTGSGFLTSQIGLTLAMKFAISNGVTFNSFLILLKLVTFSILLISIRKLKVNYSLILALYLLFPFILDLIQLKHFIAMSLILFGFSFYSPEHKFANFRFLLTILIATAFHYVAAVFLPISLLLQTSIRRIYLVTLLFLISILYFQYIGGFNNPFFNEVGDGRLDSYFSNRSRLGFLVPIVIQLSLTLLAWKTEALLKKKGVSNNFSQIVYKANIFLLIFIPLYAINGNFVRIYRIMILPNYILYSMSFTCISANTRLVYTILLGLIALCLLYYSVLMNDFDRVFLIILNKNIFF